MARSFSKPLKGPGTQAPPPQRARKTQGGQVFQRVKPEAALSCSYRANLKPPRMPASELLLRGESESSARACRGV